MNRRTISLAVIILLVGLIAGLLIGRTREAQPESRSSTPTAPARVILFWTCSMHPQVHEPGPGKCRICGMDLIPVYAEPEAALGPRQIKLSPAAQQLAEVATATVKREPVTAEVRLVGKIEYDETKLAYITAWVPGRLDRLYVDYTGVPVRKGDHLVSLYSPELLAAQEELIQSVVTVGKLASDASSLIRERAVATIAASREKLRLWGLTPAQIKQIEENGAPQDHLTIYAPVSGVVIHQNALEGQYVQTGSQIYTIADLSQLWVKLDAYESQLPWIHYGQHIEFETEAYPGEVFLGQIAFIDPVLDSKTRTVKVRVNVPNPDGRLKPDMFVRAVVRSRIAGGGKVIDPDLADKYLCPMHPEVVRAEPGTCNICGMDLVSAKSLGYISTAAASGEAPLVIPATAPLITGTRAVVYVAVPDRAGVFEGREIVLGPRAGDQYIVREGLQEGEQVVVNGAFKIDSAVQIQAKPSMMTTTAPRPALTLSVDLLAKVYAGYQGAQQALANDDLSAADKAVASLPATGDERFNALVQQFLKASGIASARTAFAPLSNALRDALRAAPQALAAPVYVLHCPMALDGQGANWLQSDDDTHNPYFGEAMLKCGEVVETMGGAE